MANEKIKEKLASLYEFDKINNTNYGHQLFKIFKQWADNLKKQGNVFEGTSLAEDGIPPSLDVDLIALKTLEYDIQKFIVKIIK